MSWSKDIPLGTGIEIRTIGHGQRSVDEFLDRLTQAGIELVVDVRSRPGGEWIQAFSLEALRPRVAEKTIGYEWRGQTLGGIPEEESFYDEEGYVLYEPLVKTEPFMKDIGWLEHRAKSARIALLCIEEEPERCHRHALLGTVLTDRGAEVTHLRRDQADESWADVELRIGQSQQSLLDQVAWRSPQPMERERLRLDPKWRDL